MKIKALKLSVTNSYLVQAGGRWILVDTGYSRDWEVFRRRLEEAGVSASDISHLVLTHHHDDHCGLLDRVLQANSDIRIVMSHRSRELLAKGENDRAHGGGYVSRRLKLLFSLIGKFDEQWRTHAFPPYVSRESDILVEGETNLDDIGIGLRGKILETPGHTIDSISLVLEDGTCFVGDGAANLPGFAGAKNCVILVEDIEEYYATWRKLISAGVEKIFPGHGGSFPVSRLRQNMGKIKRSDILLP